MLSFWTGLTVIRPMREFQKPWPLHYEYIIKALLPQKQGLSRRSRQDKGITVFVLSMGDFEKAGVA